MAKSKNAAATSSFCFRRVTSGESSARRRRDAKTRLRDAFLRRRIKTLVVVPWFEFEEAGIEGRNAYLRAKLREAGVEA